MRICSLLPSTTEIICALGLSDSLVGITHECDYPSSIAALPAVTKSLIDHSNSSSREINTHISEAVHSGSGIYAIDNQLLDSLKPELILTQELCEVCAVAYSDVEQCVSTLTGEQTILSFEPSSVEDILDTIIHIGKYTGCESAAQTLVGQAHERITLVQERITPITSKPRVLALEWLDPLFTGGHWVPEMIEMAGGTSALGHVSKPSEEITYQNALDSQSDLIILMICGYDLEQTLTEFMKLKDTPLWRDYPGSVYVVNGSAYFSRPGPRIIDGIEILSEIINPSLFPRQKSKSDWRQIR